MANHEAPPSGDEPVTPRPGAERTSPGMSAASRHALERLRDRVERAAREVERLREENEALARRIEELEEQASIRHDDALDVDFGDDPAVLRRKVDRFIDVIDHYLAKEH